jgi:hypothetical protein
MVIDRTCVATLEGEQALQGNEGIVWPFDHFAVVATLRIAGCSTLGACALKDNLSLRTAL